MIEIFNVDMELLGAKFARMDSIEQAKFFKGLTRELMRWDSDYQKEMQFTYTANELKNEEKRELEIIFGALTYREE
jgi:hypothetical protein